jgi:kynurenine formamidase
MDAQTHFGAGPGTIDSTPLSRCFGAAHVVSIPGLAPRTVLTVEHLGPLAEKFPAGESLLLRTGWSRHHEDLAVYRDGLPRIGEELARWCVDHRVNMLGVEPPSVADVNDIAEVTAIHVILLKGGVTIVEGLTNLDALSQSRVLFGALPLPVADGDGCPCRAFAIEGVPPDLFSDLSG